MVAAMRMLVVQALLAFLALPGTVAYLVPLFVIDRPHEQNVNWMGLAIAAAGTSLLLWCVREFYVAGRGTLAPRAPPTRLVTSGPYRFSRNPMYVAVFTILVGWAVGFRSIGLTIYAACIAIAFHLRVVFYEEPWQARTFGDDWHAYRERVPRWMGRR